MVELAQNLDIQRKLRDELSQFIIVDPNWDQLTSSLPYLDAFTHEILRFYPSVVETIRVVSNVPYDTYTRSRLYIVTC